jgi:threonine dehydratase
MTPRSSRATTPTFANTSSSSARTRAYTDRSVLVSDAAMTAAVRFAIDRLKLVVEPSGAATLAWLLAQPAGTVRGPVVAVLYGGNIEWEGLAHLLGGPS